MNKFNLISDLKPTGDQPQAIEKISQKISNNVSNMDNVTHVLLF